MSETKTYNGWTNYETWLCSLWIDNDQAMQERWAERAQELVNDDPEDSISNEITLADELKEQFEQDAEELSGVTGFWSDLLSAAMHEIDWREIAEHYIADTEKPEAEEVES